MKIIQKVLIMIAISLSLIFIANVAMALDLPDKIQCSLKTQNSEIAHCKGVSKNFHPALENSVENPVRHLQHNVSRKSSYTFSYYNKATSFRDTQRPMYYYQSIDKIDGKKIKLLLIGNDSIQLDSSHQNWKKNGTFYQCKGECPYELQPQS